MGSGSLSIYPWSSFSQGCSSLSLKGVTSGTAYSPFGGLSSTKKSNVLVYGLFLPAPEFFRMGIGIDSDKSTDSPELVHFRPLENGYCFDPYDSVSDSPSL